MAASHLERDFKLKWRAVHGPALAEEFKFHPARRWRADFAHLDSMTLIEVEGGVWMKGRHNTGSGFIADCEKYLEAALLGYRVIRLAPPQITAETLERIARHLERIVSASDDLCGLLA